MKKIGNWVLAVTLVISGTTFGLTSCKEAKVQDEDAAPAVKSAELIRTSQSWDGVELPDYLQGRPELVAVKYEFPAGQKLGWHHHPVMNYGILVQGELTIIGQDGKEKTVHEGEAVVEMVNTIHHGENRGTSPSSSTCSTSRRRICPWLFSTQRFRWIDRKGSGMHPPPP